MLRIRSNPNSMSDIIEYESKYSGQRVALCVDQYMTRELFSRGHPQIIEHLIDGIVDKIDGNYLKQAMYKQQAINQKIDEEKPQRKGLKNLISYYYKLK